jgi:hAT family C-terminal dimerisation region
MAAAARDYLAIPSSEVSVERLFNAGRDIISLQRFSLHAITLRELFLLRHSIKQGSRIE